MNAGERVVKCPYNPSHQIAESRLQYHLVKCKRNYPHKEKVNIFEVTQKNNLHKFDLDSEWNQVGGLIPPSKVNLPPPAENWDTEDTPSPLLLLEASDKPILRNLQGATKSERKRFRMNERWRMQAVVRNMQGNKESKPEKKVSLPRAAPPPVPPEKETNFNTSRDTRKAEDGHDADGDSYGQWQFCQRKGRRGKFLPVPKTTEHQLVECERSVVEGIPEPEYLDGAHASYSNSHNQRHNTNGEPKPENISIKKGRDTTEGADREDTGKWMSYKKRGRKSKIVFVEEEEEPEEAFGFDASVMNTNFQGSQNRETMKGKQDEQEECFFQERKQVFFGEENTAGSEKSYAISQDDDDRNDDTDSGKWMAYQKKGRKNRRVAVVEKLEKPTEIIRCDEIAETTEGPALGMEPNEGTEIEDGAEKWQEYRKKSKRKKKVSVQNVETSCEWDQELYIPEQPVAYQNLILLESSDKKEDTDSESSILNPGVEETENRREEDEYPQDEEVYPQEEEDEFAQIEENEYSQEEEVEYPLEEETENPREEEVEQNVIRTYLEALLSDAPPKQEKYPIAWKMFRHEEPEVGPNKEAVSETRNGTLQRSNMPVQANTENCSTNYLHEESGSWDYDSPLSLSPTQNSELDDEIKEDENDLLDEIPEFVASDSATPEYSVSDAESCSLLNLAASLTEDPSLGQYRVEIPSPKPVAELWSSVIKKNMKQPDKEGKASLNGHFTNADSFLNGAIRKYGKVNGSRGRDYFYERENLDEMTGKDNGDYQLMNGFNGRNFSCWKPQPSFLSCSPRATESTKPNFSSITSGDELYDDIWQVGCKVDDNLEEEQIVSEDPPYFNGSLATEKTEACGYGESKVSTHGYFDPFENGYSKTKFIPENSKLPLLSPIKRNPWPLTRKPLTDVYRRQEDKDYESFTNLNKILGRGKPPRSAASLISDAAKGEDLPVEQNGVAQQRVRSSHLPLGLKLALLQNTESTETPEIENTGGPPLTYASILSRRVN